MQGSTEKLAIFSGMMDMRFVTVDVDPINTQRARRVIDLLNPGAKAITERGENYLATGTDSLDFIYLDAFDFNHDKHSAERRARYREVLNTEIQDEACWQMHQLCAKVQEAAALLELAPFLDRKPRALSGGQRQRVAMGRAIVREPAVFLFDEPLSNLDAKLRTQMRVEIKRLQARLGVTSLYVTHDQVEAMTLADRLMVMNAGVAEQVGTPMEVYRRPASTFVAGFIGSPAMNFLAGRIAADGAAVELPGGERLAAGRPLGRGRARGHRRHPPGAPRAGPGRAAGRALHVTAELVEALGADTLVHGRLGADDASFCSPACPAARSCAPATASPSPCRPTSCTCSTPRRARRSAAERRQIKSARAADRSPSPGR